MYQLTEEQYNYLRTHYGSDILQFSQSGGYYYVYVAPGCDAWEWLEELGIPFDENYRSGQIAYPTYP